MNTVWIWFAVLLPIVGAVGSYLLGRRNKEIRNYAVIVTALLETVIAVCLLGQVISGNNMSTGVENICGLGLHFILDGFRSLYLVVASVMWLASSIFSREYMGHGRNRNRYYLFWLLTLSAVAGVLLSADLYTTFIFFEIMSFASFVWVIQEENEGSIHAGKLYLAIGVISGLVMLMGIMMLYHECGTVAVGEITTIVENEKMFVIGCLICVGFAAKAGLFLLHVWLPKAHTVAPAPASAILSGVLTKMGIFGILLVTGGMFLGNEIWGWMLLAIGILTMFTGAFLALFSVNFKKTLACSSVSQMGFIVTGISMYTLLNENALAMNGTLLHMLNHSVIKLVLFLTAGIIYMKTHSLDLNEIRGYGKNKPLLHSAFVVGAYSIAGIPLGSGYVSKTLIHESMVEYMGELTDSTVLAWVEAAELLFLVTGGMTLAYMLKLYIAVFWEDGKAKVQPLCRTGSLLTVLVPAAVLLVFGVLPNYTMDKVAEFGRLTEVFVAENHHGTVHYFTPANLEGAVVSISIGLILYFGFVRLVLMKKVDGRRIYVDRLPEWFDLEKNVYQPIVLQFLPFVFGFFSRVLDKVTDFFALVIGKKIFRPKKKKRPAAVGNGVSYAVGSFLDGIVHALNATVLRKKPCQKSFVNIFAITAAEFEATSNLVTRSVSFGLLLFCIGLIMTLLYLLFS